MAVDPASALLTIHRQLSPIFGETDMQKSTLFFCIYLLISALYAPAASFAHAQNTSPALNTDISEQAKIKQGKLVSKIHCTRCHVVGNFNPHGGISSTPSFSLLVNYLDDWEERFLSFHLRRPHPAIIRFRNEKTDPNNPPSSVPVILEYTDVEAITAFAKTLQKPETK